MPELERVLSTKRLVLEPVLPAHARLVYPWLQDERMWRYEPARHRPASLGELEQRYARYASRRSPDGLQTWLNYAVRLVEGPCVGMVQATIEGTTAFIGYSIFVEHWRHGYGKEACRALVHSLFHEHGVAKVAATVDVENAASIALLEGLGFVRVWTGPSDDMPGRTDHRYEIHPAKPAGAPSAL